MICYDFVFSVKALNNSKSLLTAFLDGYYNLLDVFFSEISIENVNIQNLKDYALYEVVDNEYYNYEESSIANDLSDFAKQLGLDKD